MKSTTRRTVIMDPRRRGGLLRVHRGGSSSRWSSSPLSHLLCFVVLIILSTGASSSTWNQYGNPNNRKHSNTNTYNHGGAARGAGHTSRRGYNRGPPVQSVSLEQSLDGASSKATRETFSKLHVGTPEYFMEVFSYSIIFNSIIFILQVFSNSIRNGIPIILASHQFNSFHTGYTRRDKPLPFHSTTMHEKSHDLLVP